MDRLLIVRLGAMGDIIHALPAVAALQQAFPDAHIGWVMEERWAELLAAPGAARERGPARPLVDAIHFANTRAWREALLSDETWREIGNALGEVRAARYDAAIDFQGLWKSALLARWSGATVFGFGDPKERSAGMLYSRRIVAASTHVILRNLELASAVTGRPENTIRFPLPQGPAAEAWCDAELERRRLRTFALLSPGAGWGAKAWPAESYGELARELALAGRPALINIGPGEEELGHAIEQASEGAAQVVRCSLGELVSLTRRASLFIGGDSGPTHLAGALGVPLVAVFGPTDPARNAPYATRAILLRSSASTTSYQHTAHADQGLLSISTAEVLAAARRVLEEAA